jgi:hypothetical protein
MNFHTDDDGNDPMDIENECTGGNTSHRKIRQNMRHTEMDNLQTHERNIMDMYSIMGHGKRLFMFSKYSECASRIN